MDTVPTMLFRPPAPEAPLEPLPLSSFLRAVRTNTLTIWPQAAYREYATSRNFLGRTNVLLNAPDDIQHVLVGNAGNYRRSPASIRILQPITGEGLLLSEGDAWKLQRRTIAPALAPRMMRLLTPHIVASADRAMARFTGLVGQPVDLLREMQTLALDIAGRSMFSLEMDRHGVALRTLMTEFAERCSRPSLLDMLLPPSVPTPGDVRRRLFKRRWMGLIEAIIQSRIDQPLPEKPRDLFDLLRAARDPETGAGFSAVQLRDQVATLILAGHETTAVTLFWASLMLAQAPQEQDWLADEAKAVTIEAQNAHEDVAGLVRTRAVVNETLRLFPPAFTLVRAAIQRDKVGEVDLPAGSIAMIAPWVLHRHQKLWRDPEVFRPARFMPDQPAPARYAFMPFGAGPRICVGAQFAMTEAVLLLARLIGQFTVARVDARPVVPVGVVTTQPDHAALVRLAVRA